MDTKETCYICGEDATGSDQTIIEDGIPLPICVECGGGLCGPIEPKEEQ